MKFFFLTFITCTIATSAVAADRYYSNAADEVIGKAQYNRLQTEVYQTAKKDQQRRKQLNAREGEIILTNDEVDQRLDLLGRYITHPESKKAIDFVNNAKTDPYEQKQVDPVNMDGFYFDPSPQKPNSEFQYKFGNGGGVNESQIFNPNLGRQK